MINPERLHSLGAEEFAEILDTDIRGRLERHLLFKSKFTLSREDIQDIVQETLLRYVKRRRDFLPEPTISWLYTVAGNLYTDHVRSNTSHPTTPIEDTTPAPVMDDDVLLKKALEEAFLALDENEQRVLYGVSIGQTHPEMAEELGVPQTTVAHWVRTGKEKLRADPRLSGIFTEGGKR